MSHKALLAVPTYDGRTDYGVSLRVAKAKEQFPQTDVLYRRASFLTFQFNQLWCHCLNDRNYTHFVMLHSDIVPSSDDWFGRLIDLTDSNGADILSVLSPIKNRLGLTSTALVRGKGFENFRRVTMHELGQLPDTFGTEELKALFGWSDKDARILANTGLMCVRMQKRSVLETMVFDVHNWIRKNDEGKFYPVSAPEDWDWSEQAQRKGLKVLVNKSIVLEHIGEWGYRNDEVWGLAEHDSGDPKR